MDERFKRLVLASSNPGKLGEFKALLAPLGITLSSQAEHGVTEASEPYATFLENALEKARHASLATGQAALADDSGLCVDVLGGAPGVHSARYAGEPRSDERNNQRLVAELASLGPRTAHYYCVLVAVRYRDDPEPIVAEGRWDGEVVLAPRGRGGFGYDPYFYLPAEGCTAAELAPERKNLLSHRAQALRRLLARLGAA